MVGDGDLGRTGQGYSRICFDCVPPSNSRCAVVGGTWAPPMRIQLRPVVRDRAMGAACVPLPRAIRESGPRRHSAAR